jgi:Asp-tRNA(Asn)/Glu-tRNA(Gln) amidotransferase A subunit family amidase
MPLNLTKSTLEEVADALENGTVTSVSLVTAYQSELIYWMELMRKIVLSSTMSMVSLFERSLSLHRTTNVTGNVKVCERCIDPTVSRIAQKLDQERAEGNIRSRLHGVPILLK